MAIKLGRIFSLDPTIWLHIESKNELAAVLKEKEDAFAHYSLDDLVRKVG